MVSLESSQYEGKEKQGSSVMTTRGRQFRNELLECWTIFYPETEATGLEGSMTFLHVYDNQEADLVRLGANQMSSRFVAGEHHSCQMRTEYGNLEVTFLTNHVKGQLNYRGGKLEISYNVQMGSQTLYHMVINLSVKRLRPQKKQKPLNHLAELPTLPVVPELPHSMS